MIQKYFYKIRQYFSDRSEKSRKVLSKSNKKRSSNLFYDLADHLTKISYRQEMRDFLQALLTSYEQREIAERLKVVQLRKKGFTYQEIREKLGVSADKIRRCSREIKKGGFKGV